MKVMILAAGRGERMRPLTDHTPKPLLRVGGKSLIAHLIERLTSAGFEDIVINHAHLGELIEADLGDGRSHGVRIQYSREAPAALETGGGIFNALPLLGPCPFLAVNADIWTDFPFQTLDRPLQGLAHLVLVDNPSHHTEGDFALRHGMASTQAQSKLTFSGIGVYRHELFSGCTAGKFSLVPLLRQAADRGQLSAEHYPGEWMDIGTPQRLAELDERLGSNQSSGRPIVSRDIK